MDASSLRCDRSGLQSSLFQRGFLNISAWKNSRGDFVSYWFRDDNRLPQARLAVVSYVIVGMIGLLLIGFWKLQVIDSDKYSAMG